MAQHRADPTFDGRNQKTVDQIRDENPVPIRTPRSLRRRLAADQGAIGRQFTPPLVSVVPST